MRRIREYVAPVGVIKPKDEVVTRNNLHRYKMPRGPYKKNPKLKKKRITIWLRDDQYKFVRSKRFASRYVAELVDLAIEAEKQYHQEQMQENEIQNGFWQESEPNENINKE